MFYQGVEKREGPFWGVVPDRGIRPHLTNLRIHASGLSIVLNQADFPDETCVRLNNKLSQESMLHRLKYFHI